MNRRAGEQLMSIWWFVILAFVGVGIVGGVVLFSSGEINTKEVEAKLLQEKFIECLHAQDNINLVFDQEKVYSLCNLHKQSIDNNLFLYAKLSNSKVLKEIRIGNNALENDCNIILTKESKGDKYPECLSFSQKITDLNGDVYNLVVVSGSNHYGAWK